MLFHNNFLKGFFQNKFLDGFFLFLGPVDEILSQLNEGPFGLLGSVNYLLLLFHFSLPGNGSSTTFCFYFVLKILFKSINFGRAKGGRGTCDITARACGATPEICCTHLVFYFLLKSPNFGRANGGRGTCDISPRARGATHEICSPIVIPIPFQKTQISGALRPHLIN